MMIKTSVKLNDEGTRIRVESNVVFSGMIYHEFEGGKPLTSYAARTLAYSLLLMAEAEDESNRIKE